MEFIELGLKDDTFSRNTTLEDELERKELIEKVLTTLLGMQPVHRRILLFRHYIGMEYDELYREIGGKRKKFSILYKEAHQEFKNSFMTRFPEYCLQGANGTNGRYG